MLFIITLVCAITLTSIEAQATNLPSAADLAGSIMADVIGVNGGGLSSTVPDGIVDTRTGYICYLLEADGTNPKLPAYAFYSSGYTQLDNTHWIAQSRRGHCVTQWEAEAPWGIRPFNINKTTNYAQLKEWMGDTSSSGTLNIVNFVATTWEQYPNAVEKFRSGEYVLCLETLLHFQFSFPSEKSSGPPNANSIDIEGYLRKKYNLGPDWYPSPQYISDVRKALNEMLKEEWEKNGGSKQGFTKVAYPIIGTPSNCTDFYNYAVKSQGPNWFKSFLNNVAPFAEYVQVGSHGEKAGFKAWTGSTHADYRLSESDLDSHGLALAVFKVKSDTINTYSPPQGSPGKAEDPNPGKTGTTTIVKGYYTENEETGEKVSDGVYTQPNTTNKINIMEEPEYQLVSWNISTAPPTEPDPAGAWISTPKGGITPTTVTLETNEKTLYVLLKKVEEAELEVDNELWVLEESEITAQKTTKNKEASNGTDLKLTVTLPTLEKCNAHTRNVDETVTKTGYNPCDEYCPANCPGGHTYTYETTESKTETYYCDSWTLDDKKFSLLTKNTNEDNAATSKNVLAKDSNFKTKNTKNPTQDERTSTAEEDIDTEGYNYKFIIHRFNKDKLSFYQPEPSEGSLPTIQGLGTQFSIKTLAEKGSKTRKTSEYAEHLKIVLEYDKDKSSDNSTSSDGDEGCNISSTDISSSDKIEFEGDITIKTYSGVSRVPDTTINTNRMLTMGASGFNTTSGRMVQSSTTVSFNPFIQMSYKTLDNSKQNVYVISEWQRQIIPNDYAEISWNKAEDNLRITSNQWSTHADSLKLSEEIHGSAKTNCMLPGGAVYSLDMKKNGGATQPQIIQLKTYQTIVHGKARQNSSLKNDSTLMTDTTAISEHQAFVDSVASTLEGTTVDMWVNKDPKASKAWNGGIVASPGADISSLNNSSSRASSDTKYYLVPDADNNRNASRSDLDTNVTHMTKVYHRVWSDAEGNIRYTKGNSADAVMSVGIKGGTVILSKGQDASAIGGEVKNIDNRTGFVTKYVAAVERNTGNDTTADWASDGKWYNEAWYGIIVVEQTSKIEVRFHATDVRTTVLDPKLVPKITKKAGEPMKAFLFQYKTALPNQAPMGTFRGQSIYMNDADFLFQSQKAYIISQTVQDLS